jgi:hypothetical protein
LFAALVGAIISAVALAASFPVIGPSARFAAGLAAGIVSGSLCVFLIGYFLNLAADKRKALFSSVGFFIRIIIFAGVFYAALRFGGYEGAAGQAIAFLAPYVGVSLTPLLLKLYKRIKGDGSSYLEEQTEPYTYMPLRDSAGRRRHVFIKNFDTVRYYGGRRYVTHRSFRRLKEMRGSGHA